MLNIHDSISDNKITYLKRYIFFQLNRTLLVYVTTEATPIFQSFYFIYKTINKKWIQYNELSKMNKTWKMRYAKYRQSLFIELVFPSMQNIW